MGDYIERDKVIREMEWYIERFPDCAECLEARKRIIAHIPPADVRPVVLCKDCIFRSNEWTGCPKLNGTITGDEFFCKCGVKREES